MWNIQLPPANWYDINTPGLGEFIETVSRYPVIAIDTETTGLNVMDDMPLFWSLAYGQPGKITRTCLSATTLHSFAPLFADKDKRWAFANAKFDTHMLANVGIQIKGHLVDTQVMHALLFEEFPHGLKDMAKQILGWKWSDFFDTFGKPSKAKGVTAGDLLMKVYAENPGQLVDYASNDAYGTLELFYNLDNRLCDAPTISLLYPDKSMTLADLFYETEVPFTKILWKCEREGIRVDLQRLEAMKDPMEKEMAEFEQQMWKLNEAEFNPNSSQQLIKYFIGKKGLPVIKKTKGGKSGAPQPCVDAEVLKIYKDEYGDEMAGLVDSNRELAKLFGTYVCGLADKVDREDRIHTRFNQDVARCMPVGELVLTSDGYKRVEDVQLGDLVLTHRNRYRAVVETSRHAPTDIYQVYLQNGLTLRTNGEHRYYIVYYDPEVGYDTSAFVKAEHLRVGDRVVVHLDANKNPPIEGYRPHMGEITEPPQPCTEYFTESTVIAIVKQKPEVVCGLTVDEDHTHVTGGIVTHNTGRLSSSNPNLQNIPRHRDGIYDLRSAFIPRRGNRMIVADYEALEMRILADQANEPDMIDIFRKGLDIHAGNGSMVFGYPYEDIMTAKDMDDKVWDALKKNDKDKYDYLKSCKRARGDAKTICFGLNYGMQAFNLSKQLKCTIAEAKTKMEQYLTRYPSVRHFFQQATEIVQDTGFAFTYLGRRRTLTDINANSKMLRSRAERQASNVPIQGSSADVVKMAMLKIDQSSLHHMGWNMISQVHDELIFEGPPESCDDAQMIIRQCMEHPFDKELNVPLPISMKDGMSWAEAK